MLRRLASCAILLSFPTPQRPPFECRPGVIPGFSPELDQWRLWRRRHVVREEPRVRRCPCWASFKSSLIICWLNLQTPSNFGTTLSTPGMCVSFTARFNFVTTSLICSFLFSPCFFGVGGLGVVFLPVETLLAFFKAGVVLVFAISCNCS